MNIYLDNHIDKDLADSLAKQGHAVFTDKSTSYKEYDFAVATPELYKNQNDLKAKYHFLVISDHESLDIETYNQIKPVAVFNKNQLNQIPVKIENLSSSMLAHQKAAEVRNSVEAKRQELERLNFFLTHQEKEKSSALRVFHVEESNKKQREKKLLFFLDFINTNYSKSSFLDELFLYLSQEIKKIGNYYQLGILVAKKEEKEIIYYRYDQRNEYQEKKMSEVQIEKWSAQTFSNFLANIYQRPVGKLLLWSTHSEHESIYFYIENPSKESDLPSLENFVGDRMSLLSMVISRWSAEQLEKSILRQWREMFQAYKDPIHVVDDDFNIILSNYTQELDSHEKCYKILASRDSKCVGCPIENKNHESLTRLDINDTQYRLFYSSFGLEKKYNLLFYEDLAEINSLRSQIVQSEKMNTIGNLANHLSHELNNPLTGLKLATDFLISDLDQYESQPGYNNLRGDLDQISKALVRSEVIIKDLVDFSNPVENKLESVDLLGAVNRAITLLKSILRTTRIFIDIKPKEVLVHPVYLQQVIFNLVKNSCEAMKFSGSIKIYQTEQPGEVNLVIEDAGPGISEDQQKFLFNPFFTTKSEKEGTGLGLYLCRNLMRKMNADLVFDSSYKSGARFILRFKT